MLSATIITHNEERNIERCLNSLMGVVDEIIVVDSYSTDSTPDICRRYGAKVTQRVFSGYGPQRQYAASLAGGRYVLSIDADEVLTEELRDSLKELRRDGFRHRMYSFRVVNYVNGQAVLRSGLEPIMQTRLFDKRYASWDMLDVGERLSYPAGVLPEPIKGEMHHFRCNTGKELEFKEIRNARMRGRMMAAAGIDANVPLCWLRAACSFLNCAVRQGAMLDGEAGRTVAKVRFKSTLAAYLTARNIARESKEKRN